MTTGTVVRIIRDRGFGFIRPEPEGEDIFFHASAVADGRFDALEEGVRVEFEQVRDARGRGMRAENVYPLGVAGR